MTGPVSADGIGRVQRALDDALYYLRRGCEPCAQRYFDRALRYGATDHQIGAVRAAAVSVHVSEPLTGPDPEPGR